MNEFVEECRREWKRLGVSDPVANEMAADLDADLAEAASEGASPEDVLGTGAFDPKSFAANWASERGLIGVAPASARYRRIPVVPAAFVALALVGLVLVVATPTRTTRVAVPATARVAFLPRLPALRLRPGLPRIWMAPLRRPAQVIAVTGGGRRTLWWIGLGALVIGAAGTIWSTLARSS